MRFPRSCHSPILERPILKATISIAVLSKRESVPRHDYEQSLFPEFSQTISG